MITKYNVMVCPFNLWGRTIRNPLTVMKERMLTGTPITHRSRTIGYVMSDSIKVGSDGFYANINVVDTYANTVLEFRDLGWDGFPCDENKWVIESIARIVMQPKTR